MEEDLKVLEEKIKNFNEIKHNILDLNENTLLKRFMLDAAEVQLIKNLIRGYRELEESEKYLYDAYQDVGKKMFEYSEEAEELKKRCKELEQIEEAHRELNGELRKELQLKDKMIDLMAQEILNYDNQFVISFFKNKEHAKEYFTKKASEENE